MAKLNLYYMPAAKQDRIVDLPLLNGGLNLHDLEYRLKNNESPEMMNLLWREGALCSRDGQSWVVSTSLGTGYTIYDRLFNGFLVAHIGGKLYMLNPKASTPAFTEIKTDATTPASVAIPTNRGSWFTYNEKLYYKNKGGYFEITFHAGDDTANPVVPPKLTITSVTGYTPVTVINADPSNGAGDLYQPENRISAAKTVRYNAVSGVTNYYLPVQNVSSVDKVIVDGAEVVADTTNPPAADKYYADLTNGKVVFGTAPPVTTPATNNTVEITYSKADTDGYNSIMDCIYAATYGGTGNLCVVMGGCPAQPNAIFWNGNNIAMDPTYFPYSQYQLCGDTDDPVTGFGKQQSFLVVFQTRSVGRVKQDTTTIDGRLVIDMPYIAINDKTGCDLPWSIQLIDNNLVWCNTEQGVHILKDSSYAYENNVECVSTKVNGSKKNPGLLENVRGGTPTSIDDTKRYWLCCNGEVWVWDYENTSYKDPSWYRLTDIYAVAFATELDDLWHLDALGRLTHFDRSYEDYPAPDGQGHMVGRAIRKRYRFAVQYFGGYDHLKNVNSVIIVMRPDTASRHTRLTYLTDYEERQDLTNLNYLPWSLVPRDLTFRSLAGRGFGAVFRRRPMCRRVRHFTMRLDNDTEWSDLSVVSAQIFYNYQGRLR